jgi:AraC-like DNA-binding protein
MMYSFQDLLLSAAATVNVVVSIMVAAVRWGHRCEPYAKHMDYYYPAWKAIIACFLTNIILSTVIFMPNDEDAILQLRMMFIMGSPFFCATLMFVYFGKSLKTTKWRRPIFIMALIFAILMGTSTTLAIIPGNQIVYRSVFCKWLFSITGIMALLFMTCFIQALRMIILALRRFSEENYSNPDDFPHQYASEVIWIPVLNISASWCASFIGTQTALSISLIIVSVLNAIFLIGALSPHRSLDVSRLEKENEKETEQKPCAEQPEPTPEPVSQPNEESISQERKEEIARTIRHFVEDEQAYLDNHLTLASLSRTCGINRTYVSQVISERMGGFYTYVNRCRLAHAAQFKVQNPGASVEEIASASGFGTRQTYYNILHQLEK